MTEPDGAQRAREWLERQLAELGQLRNASRRDPNFKNWRQQTLTVIQRVWPGDTRRVDRFRRIPFSPPTSHSTDAQVRDSYERGWGEAGVLLREFLAEINLLGLPQNWSAGTYAGSETEAAMGPVPSLGDAPLTLPAPEVVAPPAPAAVAPPTIAVVPEAVPSPALAAALAAVNPPALTVVPAAVTPSAPAAVPAASKPDDGGFGDDISRAMDRLLGRSPAVRRSAPAESPEQPDEVPQPDSPAAELMRVARELEALGLPPARVRAARTTLLALARAAQKSAPPWELVGEALSFAGATPALARRILPLLLEFIATAA